MKNHVENMQQKLVPELFLILIRQLIYNLFNDVTLKNVTSDLL